MNEQISSIERHLHNLFDLPDYKISTTERLRSLLVYRNDRRLYRRSCDQTGDTIFSPYRADNKYKVIKSSLWWDGNWDALNYGFDPKIELDFFDQFLKLQKIVPREGTSVVNSENSEFNSHTRDSKNVYLSHLAARCEDILYSYWSVDSKDLCDCSYVSKSSYCYDSLYLTNCYQCILLQESANCSDCLVGYQLRNCQYCICCSNLNNKTYHYKNKPCTKEQFEKIRTAYLQNYSKAKSDLKSLKQKFPTRAMHSLNSENVSGEHILNSQNCIHCFDIMNSQDCFNLTNGGGTNVVHGYSVGFPECENIYCSVTLRSCQNMLCCSNCWSCDQLWYCDNCVSCRDCFACVGLKHKRFCFFNKQLSEIEYRDVSRQWKMLLQLRNQWGKFFPESNSPFAYNESAAQDFFPLSREEAVAQKLNWCEFPERIFSKKVENEELKKCINCSLPFRVAKKELEFYQKLQLQNPESCPECRLESRLRDRNPYALFKGTCSDCMVEVETSYKDINVLCESCYSSLYLA